MRPRFSLYSERGKHADPAMMHRTALSRVGRADLFQAAQVIGVTPAGHQGGSCPVVKFPPVSRAHVHDAQPRLEPTGAGVAWGLARSRPCSRLLHAAVWVRQRQRLVSCR